MTIKKGLYLMFMISILFSILLVDAEKFDIKLKNNYIPGEDLNINIKLYDDSFNTLNSEINYRIENYYSDVMSEGTIVSGETLSYIVPNDAIEGPWRISVKSKDIEANRLFNIAQLKKADITIEGDELVIKNMGNVVYDRPILIYINEEHQTYDPNIGIGDIKRLKLTAPPGEYTVRINDGTVDNDLVFDGVTLTGNVIGLQSSSVSPFWKKYPVVVVFLVALLIVSAIMFSSRLFYSKENLKKK